MKPPDILGLVVRVVGFFLMIYGLWNFLYGIESLPAALVNREDAEHSPLSYIMWGLPVLLFGAGCFFCADWIVKSSYRNRD